MYLAQKPHVIKGGIAAMAWLVCATTLANSTNPANPTPPDAGALQKQIEQSLPTPLPQVRHQIQTAPQAPSAPDAVTVTVSEFRFVGNTLIDDAHLREVVQPFLQRPLNFHELEQAAVAVAQAYRDAGWVVKAYLPKQSIEQGVVTIQIVEATLGQTSFTTNPFERVPATTLRAFVEKAQPSGQAVQSHRIDRALLLMDDLPGVMVTGNLTEGTRNGETDLLLHVMDEPLFVGNATLDNTGATSTGTTRLLGNLNINSPLHQGDLFNALMLQTQSSDYIKFSYSLPVGSDGWRLGTHTSWMSYHLIGDFATSGLSGTSSASGLDLTYPVIRDLYRNLNVSASYDLKHLNNVSPANPIQYHLDVWGLNVSGNQTDDWGGGGLSNAALILTHGQVNLNGASSQASDAASANTQGEYNKWGVSLNRLQTLTSDVSAYLALTAQTANKNLDSSEKIYIGGANGVRAYPGSDGSGTSGFLLTTELRQRLDEQFTTSEFYDYGSVTAFKNNLYTDGSGLNSGSNPNHYALQGWGVSIGWHGMQGSEFKLSMARRIGTNPIANTTTGMDGDGTHIINRFWLSAGIAF